MGRLSFIAVVGGIALLMAPSHAQAKEERSCLGDMLELGSRALGQAIQQGAREIQDRIEITAGTAAGSREGERSARLSLRLFPKGKSHPEEEIRAETQLDYSVDPAHPHLSFDFTIVPRRPPDEYI